MKRTLTICAAVLAFSVVTVYAAWMTNANHHAQVRIPDGWNTTYKVMVGPENKQAHLVLANNAEDEKLTMVAAIASMEVGEGLDLDTFMEFLEKKILENATVVEKQKRGFNNLSGVYVIYDAMFGGEELRLMCFFTKKDPYFYAIFTGTEKDKFEERKPKLDEILVTFQYVEKP